MTHSDLKELAGLKQLRSLGFDLCPGSTDMEVTTLANLKQLRTLRLRGFPNTADADLKELAGLKQLRSLRLFGCPNLTDAGLVHLQPLTKLELLLISGTQVTGEGIETLRQALPTCTISVPWPHSLTDRLCQQVLGRSRVREAHWRASFLLSGSQPKR